MKLISDADFKTILSVLKMIQSKPGAETLAIQNTKRKAVKLYKKLQKYEQSNHHRQSGQRS